MTYPEPIYLTQTNSTSDVLRQMAAEGEADDDFTSVVAGYQTNGRGQIGNHWESEPGQNLLISTILHPHNLDVSQQFLLSIAATLAVRDTICSALPDALHPHVKVKWPNDIYVNDQKVSGILVENQLQGRLITQSIIGVGINVNQTKFAYAPNPTSIKLLTNSDTSLYTLTDNFLQALDAHYHDSQERLLNNFHLNLYRADNELHPFVDHSGHFQARISHIDPDGRLYLQLADNTMRSYLFKEVEYIIHTSCGDIAPNL